MFSRGMIDSPNCAGEYGRDGECGRDGARPSRGDVYGRAGRVVPRHDPMWHVCENDVMVRLDAVTPQVPPQVAPPVTPQVAPPVTPPVAPPVAEWFDSPLNRLLYVIGNGEKSAQDIRAGLALVDRTHVRSAYVDPALHLGYIEYTIPDKPHSRLQKYRLTAKGKELLAQLLNESEEKKS